MRLRTAPRSTDRFTRLVRASAALPLVVVMTQLLLVAPVAQAGAV